LGKNNTKKAIQIHYSYMKKANLMAMTADVVHYRVINGGHNWPGGINLFPFLGSFNLDINAGQEIWNFFAQQSSPATARVQLIHAAADETVSVSVNGEIIRSAMAYRTATPYLDLPAGMPLEIALTPVDPWGDGGPVNASLELSVGQTYVIGIYGTFDESDNWPVALQVLKGAVERVAGATAVGLSFFQGVPDFPLPAFDVVYDGSVLFDNLTYGDIHAFQTVPAADLLTFGTPADDNETINGTFVIPLSFWKGRTAVLFNSGSFADGSWVPWMALSNGGTFPILPPGGEESLQLPPVGTQVNPGLRLAPNPVHQELRIDLRTDRSETVRLELIGPSGRLLRSRQAGTLSAGQHHYSMDLSDLPAGRYFLRALIGDRLEVHPLIVVHP
jgi:hypothetical protein